MEPIHFGPASRLFGLRSEPAGAPVRRTALLICNTWGVEYMRCYRALHLLSRDLAARGIETLRFDYTGTGDSGDVAGGPSLEYWLDDIREAVVELRQLAGTERIAILGLRLGALLAVRAVDAGLRVDHLILWDPPASGQAWIEELQALDREHYERKNRYLPAALQLKSRPEELLGQPCPASLQHAIGPLAAAPAASATNLITLLSPDVQAGTAAGEQIRLPDASHWTDIEWVTRPWTPAGTPRVICDTLSERLQ